MHAILSIFMDVQLEQLGQNLEIVSKKVEKGEKAYENQVLEQVKDLNAVFEKVKTFKNIDINNLFVLGSNMGGLQLLHHLLLFLMMFED